MQILRNMLQKLFLIYFLFAQGDKITIHLNRRQFLILSILIKSAESTNRTIFTFHKIFPCNVLDMTHDMTQHRKVIL